MDATSELDKLRQRKIDLRRRRYRFSKLTRYRAEIVALRKAGASYREIEEWLRRNKYRRIAHSTIRRYLLQLPEMQEAD